MTKLSIFVTGSSGMVGKNLLEHLSFADNYNVIAPRRDELDLADFNSVLKVLDRNAPDIVIHLAGLVGGIQSNIANSLAYMVANLDIGKNVILSCQKIGIPKLINLASSCMYPRNCSDQITESMILSGPLELTNEGYAIAKIVTTRLCQYISAGNSMLSYKTMVPCNLYGKFDKFDPERSHLIPAVIRKIHDAKVNNRPFVDIWGDGLARREFMYAKDMANALVYGVENYETMPDIVNIGIGQDFTINQYYQYVSEIIGYEGQFFYDLEKPVGMNRKLLSTKLQTAWGWAPHYSLKEGLEQTYAYYLELANKN